MGCLVGPVSRVRRDRPDCKVRKVTEERLVIPDHLDSLARRVHKDPADSAEWPESKEFRDSRVRPALLERPDFRDLPETRDHRDRPERRETADWQA